ncbi:MAG: hypothetical protein BGO69_17345 [Bacteroidetes bacterium 46-16]|nr:MAG: hypothetical protein BGO69_17345 [Bacteroidetes bacterium 46-16]
METMEKISITHVSNVHSDWLRALNFYKDEIGILRNRLTEIAGKNSAREVMRNVEHFENQFKLQKDNIQVLTHDIKQNVKSIKKQLEDASAGYIDGELAEQHNAFSDKFTGEERVINELRHEFNDFAAQWM